MALLDMLRKKETDLVVAHVNYQKRKTALRDEEIVKAYCRKYGIIFEVLYPHYAGKTNFQAWARDVRYDFFVKMAKKYQAKEIYVAHHLDDHIETYWMQVERKSIVSCYGLAKQTEYKGFVLVRPLLGYTKAELEMYCKNNRVDYGIDESNLENHYRRNQLRHSRLDLMSYDEKLAVCKEIEEKNRELSLKHSHVQHFLDQWDQSFDERINDLILSEWFYRQTKKRLSKKHVQELLKQLSNVGYVEVGDHILEVVEGKLVCVKKEAFSSVVLDELNYGCFDDFEICSSGRLIESLTVTSADFPLTFRGVKAADTIHLRYGHKKVSRFFIDRKIPRYMRLKWFVIENREGKVIFVPQIGCDIEHFSANSKVFVLQLNPC